jgi:hypothetical protein
MIILRLMAKPPLPGEHGPDSALPIRSAGIHPGIPGAVPDGAGAEPVVPAE